METPGRRPSSISPLAPKKVEQLVTEQIPVPIPTLPKRQVPSPNGE